MTQATETWTGGTDFAHLVAFQQESAREVGHKRHHAPAAPEPENTRFRTLANQPPQGGVSR